MENQLVTILRITTPQLGSFVKDKLEAENIECFFTNEGKTMGSKYNPDEVLLKVAEKYSEKAIRILLEIHKEFDLDKVKDDKSFKDLKKILLPVKLGEDCYHIVRYAMTLAAKMNAEIKLLYVYPDPTINEQERHTVSWEKYVTLELREAHIQAQNRLVSFSREMKKQIPVELLQSVHIHYRMLKGVPEYVITDAAERYKPDFILMGTRGSHGTGEFQESMVARMVENSRFPVWVVPVTAECPSSDTLKVMYATDFNAADHASLDKLLSILQPFEKEISCVHIHADSGTADQSKVNELNAIIARDFPGRKIRCVLYESDNVPEGFHSFAEKNHIDIISFSNVRRSVFYKLFHTNLMGRMVKTERVPLLIFPV